MNTEESQLNWDDHCLVCGKSVGHHEGLCHVNIDGEMIALCCPLCRETFQKDSDKYLRRRAIRKLSSDRPQGSFSAFDL